MLPVTKIGYSGKKTLEFKLIQGGMGVGISGFNLASAVANSGGAGIIAGVALGLLKQYPGSYTQANQDALRDEIRQAKQKSNGVVGVNIMNALSDYDSLVKVAVEESADLIICGAGIPRDLPAYAGDKDIKLIPVVSSKRVLEIIIKSWSRYKKLPDAVVVEGPLAGGHLGYDYSELINKTTPTLEEISGEIINFVNDKSIFDYKIPIIVAGGIFSGQDIRYFIEKGVSGVQMATRFVPTKECDASDKFKQKYINATEEDIVIIKSPVGLPGRAIKNEFLSSVEKNENDSFGCNYKCLKTCVPAKAPYCIARALIEAQKGDFSRGYAFAGENVSKCNKDLCLEENGTFITVEKLFDKLDKEYNS